jgi:phage tail-like protein
MYVAADDPLEASGVGSRPETDVGSGPLEAGETDEAIAGGDAVETDERGSEVRTTGAEQPPRIDGSPSVDILSEEEWTTIDVTGQEDHRLSARGRYLYVGLKLVGAAGAVPAVESVRAYCARESIRRYLPDLYDDSEFLADFLAVFETVFDDVESEIAGITRYLDPDATPRQALSWLASWFGIEDSEGWPESARRELLARVPELYRKRGTKAGVRELVELYLRHAGSSADETVFFLGRNELGCIDDPSVREAVAAALPETAEVVCYYDSVDEADGSDPIETVVASETPAHVPTAAAPLDRTCSLDGTTFLGYNSRLTRRQFALGETTLHGNSTLDVSGQRENSEQRPGLHSERQTNQYSSQRDDHRKTQPGDQR